MFRTRLISGIVLLLLLIGVVGYGRDVLLFVTILLSFKGLSELYEVGGIGKTPLAFMAYLVTLGYYGVLIRFQGEYLGGVIVLALVLILGVYVFAFPKYHQGQVALTFFGIFYVPFLLSHVYQIRMLPEIGKTVVWLVFLSAWGCDTCAYCVGVLFGKHKLAPKLSPKKSIEGSVGGVIGAGLLGLLYGWITERLGGATLSPFHILWICMLGAVIAQIGDLAASGIKRNFDKKDYGTFIPGHGGVLDRFDSVIFVAPIIYYTLQWITK